MLLPVTDAWVEYKQPPSWWADDGNVYSNWHAAIAECWVATGILTDDRQRYDKGTALAHATITGYLKWGHGAHAEGRVIGETTETLRCGKSAGRLHSVVLLTGQLHLCKTEGCRLAAE